MAMKHLCNHVKSKETMITAWCLGTEEIYASIIAIERIDKNLSSVTYLQIASQIYFQLQP